MPAAVNDLARLLPLRQLGQDNARIIARAWTSRHLRTGDVLWEQEAPAPKIGLLLRGGLEVQVDGETIEAIHAGDLVGETSAFSSNARRSATVVATATSTVLLLDVYELQRLAQAYPPFQERLLDHGLEVLARRIRATDKRIAKLSHGVIAAPQEAPVSGLARLWKMLRKVGGDTHCPPLLPLIERLPTMGEQPPAVIETIADTFQARAFEKDELIAKEGEPGDAAFLLAVGEVQALRHVRNRMAEVLVTFHPGGLFSTVTLPKAGPRTATCQAATDGWLYAMDAEGFKRLEGRARRAWKECLVITQGIHFRNANALLAGFQAGTHAGGPLSDEQFARLLQAAGALVGSDAAP